MAGQLTLSLNGSRPSDASPAVSPVVEPRPTPVERSPDMPAGRPAPVASVAVARTTTAAVVLVAVVAAVASYEHMRALAAVAGEDWRSWLLPISVDGLAVAASMTMLIRRRAGLPTGALAWAALLLGLGASLAANVAAADPTVAGRLVAAWPPVALLFSYELLMQQIKARGGPCIHPSAPVLSIPSNRRNP